MQTNFAAFLEILMAFNAPAASDWRASVRPTERQINVSNLKDQLFRLQQISNASGMVKNLANLEKMAKEFESNLFFKSPSRQGYETVMNAKLKQLKEQVRLALTKRQQQQTGNTTETTQAPRSDANAQHERSVFISESTQMRVRAISERVQRSRKPLPAIPITLEQTATFQRILQSIEKYLDNMSSLIRYDFELRRDEQRTEKWILLQLVLIEEKVAVNQGRTVLRLDDFKEHISQLGLLVNEVRTMMQERRKTPIDEDVSMAEKDLSKIQSLDESINRLEKALDKLQGNDVIPALKAALGPSIADVYGPL